MRILKMKLFVCYGNVAITVYLLAVLQAVESGPVPPNEQLTKDDVFKIVELIGQTPDVDSALASDPVPTFTTLQDNQNIKQMHASLPTGGLQRPHVTPQLYPDTQKQVSLQILKDAQAALLADLVSSTTAVSPPKPIKQQDFSSFQNAEPILDQSSNNQLGDTLKLLGTLGSLAGPVTSLLSLGGKQSNPLAGLLGGGQSNLLSGLLGLGASQLKSQAPELMSTLGSLATVVGGAIRGPADGKPKLRGVDTRLGLGYRMGEDADAQFVFEIGPQLFTEPITDEQKNKLLLQQYQQQLQRLQQQQQQQNANGQFQTIHKRQLSIPSPKQKQQENSAWRRHMSVSEDASSLYNKVASKNCPLSSVSSHVFTVINGIQGNSIPSTLNSQKLYPNQLRKDNFNFSKDSLNNIVRVSIKPRQYSRLSQVSVIRAMDDGSIVVTRQRVNPDKLQKRMDSNYPAAEKRIHTISRSSPKDNLKTVRLSTIKQKRQQKVNPVRVYQRRRNSQPEDNEETSGLQTLSEWSEKNSFFDLVQNYVVDKLLN